MSALQAAVSRGKKASNARWKPLRVVWNGYLMAEVEDTRNGTVEKVYRFRDKLLFYGVGRRADGDYTVHTVRDRTLRKVVTAMIGTNRSSFRDDLVREAYEEFKRESYEGLEVAAANGAPSRARRKR